jgi:glycosyltransferase involved in cell wall biosynthesis
MNTPKPLVSVIVPCRNERGYIVECLESILRSDYGLNRIEILVVDGASDDGTPEILSEYARRSPQIQCLQNPARTAPAALNIGIMHATGDILMRMDAHCRYPDNYISALVGWLHQSGADNVGGMWRILPGSDSLAARAIAAALSHRFGAGNSYYRIGITRPKWVDTVPFGCYRRSVFERIGLFDEELIRNQDDELNQRLLRNGGRILLVPDVTIDYYARDSIRKIARMHYQYGYFKPLAAKKAGAVGTFRQIVPAIFVLSLAVTLLLGPWIKIARVTFLGIVGAYLIVLVVSVFSSATRNSVRVCILLSAVFPVIHISYGFGWLRGLAHLFVRRNAGPKQTFEVPLSR